MDAKKGSISAWPMPDRGARSARRRAPRGCVDQPVARARATCGSSSSRRSAAVVARASVDDLVGDPDEGVDRLDVGPGAAAEEPGPESERRRVRRAAPPGWSARRSGRTGRPRVVAISATSPPSRPRARTGGRRAPRAGRSRATRVRRPAARAATARSSSRRPAPGHDVAHVRRGVVVEVGAADVARRASRGPPRRSAGRRAAAARCACPARRSDSTDLPVRAGSPKTPSSSSTSWNAVPSAVPNRASSVRVRSSAPARIAPACSGTVHVYAAVLSSATSRVSTWAAGAQGRRDVEELTRDGRAHALHQQVDDVDPQVGGERGAGDEPEGGDQREVTAEQARGQHLVLRRHPDDAVVREHRPVGAGEVGPPAAHLVVVEQVVVDDHRGVQELLRGGDVRDPDDVVAAQPEVGRQREAGPQELATHLVAQVAPEVPERRVDARRRGPAGRRGTGRGRPRCVRAPPPRPRRGPRGPSSASRRRGRPRAPARAERPTGATRPASAVAREPRGNVRVLSWVKTQHTEYRRSHPGAARGAGHRHDAVDSVRVMTWMVTGGAGYIGSHVVRAFGEVGLARWCSTTCPAGTRTSSPRTSARARHASSTARSCRRILTEHDGRRRGAPGRLQVRRRVRRSARCTPTPRTSPGRSTPARGDGRRTGVDAFVFSSSAAMYGTPDTDLVTEETPTSPESPYGESQAHRRVAAARPGGAAAGLRHTSLRYFNVVGSGSPRPARHQPAQPLPARLRRARRRPDAADQRRRLPHPGRHLRARLRARRRPRPLPRGGGPRPAAGGPSSGSTTSAAAPGVSVRQIMDDDGRGHRHRLQPGDRPAAPGRPGPDRRLRRARRAGPGLEDAALAARDGRERVGGRQRAPARPPEARRAALSGPAHAQRARARRPSARAAPRGRRRRPGREASARRRR